MGSAESSLLSSASQDIQNDLKCLMCNEFLTWFPIIMYQNQGNICGRCQGDLLNRGIRNTGLEAVIKLLTVPCRYSINGCAEMLHYNNNDNNIRDHELNCSCRTFCCPFISVYDVCYWNGKRTDIQHHYREKHENFVYTPGKLLSIYLNANMTKNIMVHSMNKIFFVHIKYEMRSNIIYCGLIALEQPSPGKDYEFTIELNAGTKLFAAKSRIYKMAGNFVLNNKSLYEINLNNIVLLIRGTSCIKYNLNVQEVNK